MAHNVSRLFDIERRTQRKVSISNAESNETLAKCLPQSQSPLFAFLPREIRDLVWAFATAPDEHENHENAKYEFYNRAWHKHRLRTETSLLLACRRIWLEANRLPMQQAEHCVWHYKPYPCPRDSQWMCKLTQLNARDFDTLHFLAQLYHLNQTNGQPGTLRALFLPSDAPEDSFRPRVMHITMRPAQWWVGLGDGQNLGSNNGPMQGLLDTPDLRSTHVLKLELETTNYKLHELVPIVEQLKRLESRQFETHRIDGRRVTTKFVRQSDEDHYIWTHQDSSNGCPFWPHTGRAIYTFHVITLTWLLTFPEIPDAHVPTLRLAPRIPFLNNALEFEKWNLPAEEDPLPHMLKRFPSRRTPYFYKRRHRDQKKVDKGFWPYEKRRFHHYLEDGLMVRMRSEETAVMLEWDRRAVFCEAMAPVLATLWREKWAEEGSLLHFLGDKTE